MTHLPEGVWPQLISDLQQGRIVWQMAAVALSFAVGWGIARIFRHLSRDQEASLVRRGMRPLSTIVAPLVAAACW